MGVVISRRVRQLLFSAAAALSSAANAMQIDYTATSLGGNSWRYDYTLDNAVPSAVFNEFTVYFPWPGTVSIDNTVSAGGWGVFVAQTDPSIPDGGYVDWLNFAGSVPGGSVISGFSIDFTADVGVTPGAQAFDLIASDANTGAFAVVYSGHTVPANGTVPEPETLLLVATGLAAAAVRSRKRSVR